MRDLADAGPTGAERAGAPEPGAARARTLRAVLVAVLVAVGSVIVLPGPGRTIADGLFADDAFYYFEIAANLTHGGGLTFDTINVTNGFQPLWLLVLLPVAAAVDDPDRFVAAVWWMQVIGAAACGGLAYAIVDVAAPRARAWWPAVVIVSALPFLPLWNGGMVNGLETPVFVAAVLASVLLLCLLEARPSDARAVGLAVALAAAVLGRLDGILLLVLVAALLLARRIGTARQRVIVITAPAAVTAAMLLANRIGFGAWTQVSGATKSIWAQQLLERDVAAGTAEWQLRLANLAWPRGYLGPLVDRLPAAVVGPVLDAVIVLAVLGLYSAIGVLYWRRGLLALAVLQAFLVGKFLAYGLLQYGLADYTWYWMLDVVALVIAVAVATQGLLARPGVRRRVAAAGLAGGFLVVAVAGNVLIERGRAWLSPDPTTGEIVEYAGARDVARTLDRTNPGELMASSDAGILGFHRDAPVINADGLVNGRERLRFTEQYGTDDVPYLLAHPELEGYVNWVPVGVAADQAADLATAGFVPVPGFADCVASLYGPARNERGEFRLYLRPDRAAEWSCPVP